MRKPAVQSVLVVITLVLLVSGARRVVEGGQVYQGLVAGAGHKGAWIFGGRIELMSNGGAIGHFQIVDDTPPPYVPTVCHYESFNNVTIMGNFAAFDASGICVGENQYGPFEFNAENRVGIVDNGYPGAGVDMIDVNFYGSTGIAIPGGPIDVGNWHVR